jgi:hypothetical protein
VPPPEVEIDIESWIAAGIAAAVIKRAKKWRSSKPNTKVEKANPTVLRLAMSTSPIFRRSGFVVRMACGRVATQRAYAGSAYTVGNIRRSR